MPAPTSVQDKQAEDFAVQVYQRMVLVMIGLAIPAAWVAWIRYGRSFALVFIAGCTIALFNFYWLKRTIQGALERTVAANQKPAVSGVLLRFLIRYVLIGAILYVIFKGSAMSAYGLIGGLSLPVGAVMIEAVYQTFRALQRGL